MLKYRADIDGLRAIAVIPVILFHTGMGWASGGYVGVDVFFVISGYLITKLIADEMDAGQFSLARFYERRIRRIFPALFAVLAACFLAGLALMMPRDLVDFAKSAIATASSLSNMLFWWQSGYFDGAAEAKPLLHTWSLAVEEQFYVAFPLLLLALRQWARPWVMPILAAIGVLSFGLCVASLYISPKSGFYLAPMRAWELLLGGLLALGAVPPTSRRWVRETASVLGLVGIAAAILYFNEHTPFPGYAALLPTVGAALIIWSGASGHSSVNAMISARPIVLIGLASYSLYLWHWPILVFMNYVNIERLDLTQQLVALALIAASGFLSWRFIERPFRKPRGGGQRAVFIVGASAAAVAIAAGLTLVATGGLPSRYSPAVRAVLAAQDSHSELMARCSSRIEMQLGGDCMIGDGANRDSFIWGDSHADALTGAFQTLAADTRRTFYYSVDASCPPLLGVALDPACTEANERRIQFLSSHPAIRTVVVAARWSVYTSGRAVDFGPAESNEQLPRLISPHELSAGVGRTVAALEAAGKTVVLVYPIPETGYHIPSTLARKLLRGEEPETFTRPRAYFDHRQAAAIAALDAAGSARVVRVRPADRLCDASACKVFADGQPLYYDDDHLSLEGGRFVAPLFATAFQAGDE